MIGPSPPGVGGAPVLSIVVPVLNECDNVASMLLRLQALRQRGTEVIVVDGGSEDDTTARATPYADLVLTAERGRAAQMNAGARHARAGRLLFLHADTILPVHADKLVVDALTVHGWGRFDVRIAGSHPMFPVIAAMMNIRSRATGIATGDQAIFMRRDWFERLSGFAAQPLMEDIDLSRRAACSGPPACLRERVTTSGRRWERHGVWRTILLMWTLRLAYFFGADPKRLAVAYGYRPRAADRRQPSPTE